MIGPEMASFNVDDAYPEAIVRSLRKGFLKEETYNALKACSNLSEFKQVLEDTDYGPYIAQEASPIEIAILKKKCKEKLTKELEHIAAQSYQPLGKFLQIMLHGYQIENVVGFIEGIKNDAPLQDLLEGVDPLGYFPELKNIRTVDGDDYATLYQQVLVDIPIGAYFRKFIDDLALVQAAAADPSKKIDAKFISDNMKDFKGEKIKNLIKKIWLKCFYDFCQTALNDTSS
jgi:V-type H+-transporting ATPase subunit d